MAVNKVNSWEQAVRWLREQPGQGNFVAAAYYDDPLVDAATRYWLSEEWQAVRGFLPTGRGKALDVGAGRGIASFALAKDGFSVTALEPDGSALVGAQAIRELTHISGLPIEVTQDFSERLPFRDNQFELVFARATLHHVKDLQTACREFLRVLKPGGTLIAIRDHVISRSEDLTVFLEAHPLHKLYGGENAFLLSDYRRAIRRAGFRLDAILSPLQSPINFAPFTLASLQAELALRLGGYVPGTQTLARKLFSLPGVWPIARALLEYFDHRPGRLYSFVARRP
jgi:SAM-dependent methyltransferase